MKNLHLEKKGIRGLAIAERANEIYAEAVKAGFGEIDYTGILAHIKKLSED